MNSEKSANNIPKLFAETQLQNFHHHKESILHHALQSFERNTSFKIKIGIELEFYLLNHDKTQILDSTKVENFIAQLKEKISADSLIYEIEKEQGQGQIELKTNFTSDLQKICDDIAAIKITLKNLAKKNSFLTSFAAQQFSRDCGNALQFNISLHNQHDENLFLSDAELLKKSAGGLLQMTDAMMILLAPTHEDYARFCSQTNRNLFREGKFTAPINLSFGADNRTCAIRVPKKSARLEYRVAAANADLNLCLAAILLAIEFGIKNDIQPTNQIHGNAFDSQYSVPEFCKNLQQAREIFFADSNLIRENFVTFCVTYPQR